MLFLQGATQGVVVSTYLDGGYSTVGMMGGGVCAVTDPVRGRAEIDLDAGTADVYTKIGAATENVKTTVNLTTNNAVWGVESLQGREQLYRLRALDYMKSDYIKSSKLDLDNCNLFEANFNWQGEIQTADAEDPGGDGIENFIEYALGVLSASRMRVGRHGC
jgi:hypothetical protein